MQNLLILLSLIFFTEQNSRNKVIYSFLTNDKLVRKMWGSLSLWQLWHMAHEGSWQLLTEINGPYQVVSWSSYGNSRPANFKETVGICDLSLQLTWCSNTLNYRQIWMINFAERLAISEGFFIKLLMFFYHKMSFNW